MCAPKTVRAKLVWSCRPERTRILRHVSTPYHLRARNMGADAAAPYHHSSQSRPICLPTCACIPPNPISQPHFKTVYSVPPTPPTASHSSDISVDQCRSVVHLPSPMDVRCSMFDVATSRIHPSFPSASTEQHQPSTCNQSTAEALNVRIFSLSH